MTKRLYLEDTYLFELDAMIVDSGSDERGAFIILGQTIFYPQGGGQPSDQGFLAGTDFRLYVTMVRNVDADVRHYIQDTVSEPLRGIKVRCLVDKDRRMLNARYHTAGHLLGNVVETIYHDLKAMKGHSFPKEAYVEFARINQPLQSQSNGLPDISLLQMAINDAITKGHKTEIFEVDKESFEQRFYKLPYPIPDNKAFRVMDIESFPPVPCGGTHLSTISEIGSMAIGKIRAKDNGIRISYEVT